MYKMPNENKNALFVMKLLLTILVFASQFLWGSISKAQSPFITVSEAIWTDGIDKNKNPVHKFEENIEGLRQLYLWTRVQGEEEALSYLKEKGKLPILHQWYVYLGPDPRFEETLDLTDAVKLNVGGKDMLKKLDWQLRQMGYFDWRTWSSKRNVRPGWWKVRVVYSDGEPVLCGDDKCEYVIEIK